MVVTAKDRVEAHGLSLQQSADSIFRRRNGATERGNVLTGGGSQGGQPSGQAGAVNAAGVGIFVIRGRQLLRHSRPVTGLLADSDERGG